MYNILVKIRSHILVYLTHRMGLPVLKLIRKPELFPYSVNELKRFNAGTLGRDLIDFLEIKKLALLPYYAKHDIKHILLEYDTTDEGEGCLQFFMLGNGHISFPVIATVMYSLITMPEYWTKFSMAFQRGKNVSPISHLKWFELLHFPTNTLRININNQLKQNL